MEDRARILTMEHQDERDGGAGMQLLRRRDGNDRLEGFLRDTYRIGFLAVFCSAFPALRWIGVGLAALTSLLCGYLLVRSSVIDHRGLVVRGLRLQALVGVLVSGGIASMNAILATPVQSELAVAWWTLLVAGLLWVVWLRFSVRKPKATL